MYRIAEETPVDLNSSYSYLMMAEFFSKTCLVCENDQKEVIGFCTGNIVVDPDVMFPDTLFIWQIAVLKDYRGMGLSKQMLTQLVQEIKTPYLRCTITRENKNSIGSFRSLAKHYETEFKTSEGFTEDDFPDDKAAEMLVTIGPIARDI